MKSRLILLSSKINRQHLQLALSIVALTMLVIGVGAPADGGHCPPQRRRACDEIDLVVAHAPGRQLREHIRDLSGSPSGAGVSWVVDRMLHPARPLERESCRSALRSSDSGSASDSGSVAVSVSAFVSVADPRPSCAPSAHPRRPARGDSPTPRDSRWPHGPRDRRPASSLWAQSRTAFPWVARLDVLPRLVNGPGAKRRARHAR